MAFKTAPAGQLLEAWLILRHASRERTLYPDKVEEWHNSVRVEYGESSKGVWKETPGAGLPLLEQALQLLEQALPLQVWKLTTRLLSRPGKERGQHLALRIHRNNNSNSRLRNRRRCRQLQRVLRQGHSKTRLQLR